MTTGRLLGRLAALSARWDWKQRATALFGHRRRAQHWSRRAARFFSVVCCWVSLSLRHPFALPFFSPRAVRFVLFTQCSAALRTFTISTNNRVVCFTFFFSSPTNPSFSRWIKFILNTIFQWAFQSLLSGSPMNSVSRGRSATLFSPEERKTFINKISKVSYFKCFNWSSKRKQKLLHIAAQRQWKEKEVTQRDYGCDDDGNYVNVMIKLE